MTNRDKIKSIIIKSLETAYEEAIAETYRDIISCNDCPYWNDCRNKYDCYLYILDKLEAESEE